MTPKPTVQNSNDPSMKSSRFFINIFAAFPSTDADGIFHWNDEDASVTDLACLGCFDDSLHCLLYVLVSDDDGNQRPFDVTRVIDHATVDTSLPCFADTSYVVVRKPFDVGIEKCFFHFFELGLTNNSFNLFHNLKEFG